jgi:hypothetical protein
MLRIHAVLGQEEVSPSAKLDKIISCIKPTAAGKVVPLGSRDVLPSWTRIYEVALEYEVDVPEDCEIAPKWPGLQGVLYESDFLAQLYCIFDAKKKFVGAGDAFTSPTKVSKGKFTIRLQVRHTSVPTLEGLTDLCMLFERPLAKSVPLSFYKMKSDCLAGSSKQNGRAIAAGGSISMYVKEPAANQLPKHAGAGDILTGTYTCLKNNTSLLGSSTKPGGFPIRYVVADTKVAQAKEKEKSSTLSSSSTSSKANNSSSESSSSAEADEMKALDAAVKDAKFKHLKGLVGKPSSFNPLYDSLANEFPNDLPLVQIKLAHLVKCRDATKKKAKCSDSETCSKLLAELAQIKDTAQAIRGLINETQVAASFGVNVDKENTKEMATRKEMEAHKTAIIDGYAARCNAVLDILALLSVDGNGCSSSNDTNSSRAGDTCCDRKQLEAEFEESYAGLSKWDDVNGSKHWQLNLLRLQLKGKWGNALKLVNDLISEDKSSLKESLLEVVVIHGRYFD